MAIPYIEATWTPTGLGGTFARYEIQRSEDAGASWADVAAITTEAVDLYRDYEPARDVAVTYRIRSVRADGSASAWAAAPTTPTVASSGWLAVSNEAPELSLEFDVWRDTTNTHTWEFPTNEAEYLIAGRDGAVVLAGLEDRGDAFTLNVVEVDDTALTRSAADELLALSRSALAYVCIISPEGHRWLAHLTLDRMDQTGGRQIYTKPIRVRELTAIPSVVDVAFVP